MKKNLVEVLSTIILYNTAFSFAQVFELSDGVISIKS